MAYQVTSMGPWPRACRARWADRSPASAISYARHRLCKVWPLRESARRRTAGLLSDDDWRRSPGTRERFDGDRFIDRWLA